MFISKRTIKGTAYFYLEDRVEKKRISVLLGNKGLAFGRMKEGLETFIQKKALERAKQTHEQFRSHILSFPEILSLERLKVDYSILEDFFPSGFESFKEDEFVRYAQGSASVEGNSLSLQEALLVLTKGASVAGKKVDEIREIENMKKAAMVSKKINEINERNIKKINAAILDGFPEKHPGKYRTGPMFITASKVRPVPADKVESGIKKLLDWMEKNSERVHPLELASEFHARFEFIHPFEDGNGRTGREILNRMLQKKGFPRAIVNLSNRASYITLLERVQLSKEYAKFSKFIYLCLENRGKEIHQIIEENKEIIVKKLGESIE
ncbi:MAG: Fic family protein [Candidatus Diapherotrites archaeon]